MSAKYDVTSGTKIVKAFISNIASAGVNFTSDSIDTQFYRSIDLLAFTNQNVNSKVNFKLEESENNTDWNAVELDDLILRVEENDRADVGFQAAVEAPFEKVGIGYIGKKRYVRMNFVVDSAGTGTRLHAYFWMANPTSTAITV